MRKKNSNKRTSICSDKDSTTCNQDQQKQKQYFQKRDYSVSLMVTDTYHGHQKIKIHDFRNKFSKKWPS